MCPKKLRVQQAPEIFLAAKITLAAKERRTEQTAGLREKIRKQRRESRP